MELPSADEVFAKFSIDIERGVVTWINPPKYHPRMFLKEAGSFRRSHHGKSYCIIKINQRSVKRGYLVFFAQFRRWPSPLLDHINGDSTDDRIANLREATATQNAWNHRSRRKRLPLPMGVRNTQSGRFQARIVCNGQMFHLGAYATPEEAQAIYKSKRIELYGEFSGT
ncbi:MAG: HNH endonuclease [Patescibacteria group bacterium]|nr:HNH endonuclease [Patescibacteria group bacterium]